MQAGWRLVFLLLGLAGRAALAQAPVPPGCDVLWQISPQREASPPRVQVDLSFDGGNRSRTELLLPEGSEVAQRVLEGSPALEAVPGRPLARSVAHRPGERVTLSFAVTPGEAAWARLSPQSLVFVGRTLLPVPAGADGALCLRVEGLGPDDTLLASPADLRPVDGVLRRQGPAMQVRDWMVAAGALQQAERTVEGQRWQVVMPSDAPRPPLDADAPQASTAGPAPQALEAAVVAEAAAGPLGALRRFWADGPAPDRLLMLMPAGAEAPLRGLPLPTALVLQWPAAAPMPGPRFEETLLYTALQAWFRERFGPVAYEQRPDEAMSAWFVNGFARFYTQRLRSAAGQPLPEQAQDLTQLLQRGPAVPGDAPWLPMRWHGALREQGHAGLDAVLKRLLLPAAQARITGPLSAPLATHRLQAALRPLLADAPGHDLQQLADRTPDVNLAAQWLTARTLGPCFRFDAGARQVLAAGAEASAACHGWLDGGLASLQTLARAAKGKASGKAVAKGKSKAGAKAAGASRKTGKRARR